MIEINEEYGISKDFGNTLRHFCDKDQGKWGWLIEKEKCFHCKKLTPKKILFMYNLWKWHNG